MKNTTPEAFDAPVDVQDAPMDKEEILMKESDILAGILSLGREKDEEAAYRKIQIRRGGVLKLEFRVRPITEEENQTCWRQATRYAPYKIGQPKVAVETNSARYRSYVLYTATVDADRAKVWDNRQAKDAFNILDSIEMIDRILLAGEKSHILDIIDEISGFGEEAEELAKNS